MTTRDSLVKFSFRGKQIPEYMYEGIINYVDYGVLPGAFIKSILVGDLASCINNADSENLWLIPVYYSFLYNEIPGDIWGNQLNVTRHIKKMRELTED